MKNYLFQRSLLFCATRCTGAEEKKGQLYLSNNSILCYSKLNSICKMLVNSSRWHQRCYSLTGEIYDFSTFTHCTCSCVSVYVVRTYIFVRGCMQSSYEGGHTNKRSRSLLRFSYSILTRYMARRGNASSFFTMSNHLTPPPPTHRRSNLASPYPLLDHFKRPHRSSLFDHEEFSHFTNQLLLRC